MYMNFTFQNVIPLIRGRHHSGGHFGKWPPKSFESKKFKKLARSRVNLNICGHKIAQIKGLSRANFLKEVLVM